MNGVRGEARNEARRAVAILLDDDLTSTRAVVTKGEIDTPATLRNVLRIVGRAEDEEGAS
ncbi:hypothetical protein HDC95_001674 [Microbacterium sp. AK031]|nr:hypothetical protein [Microbacterium sp. AK031]